MHSTFITARLFSGMRPSFGIRLIPAELNSSRLGPEDHSYVCIGDYEEFRGHTIREIANTLFGIDFPQGDENGFSRKYSFPHRLEHWSEAWRVFLIRLDNDRSVDLFPGTWKSVAFIMQDRNRMKRNVALFKHFLKAMRGGKHNFASKRETNFLELDPDFDWRPDANPQNVWYNYIICGCGWPVGGDIIHELGITNYCWHGRGYLGTAPVVLARVFLIKNLEILAPAVIDLGVLSAEQTPGDFIKPFF